MPLAQVAAQKQLKEQHQRRMNEARAEQDAVVQMIVAEQSLEKQVLQKKSGGSGPARSLKRHVITLLMCPLPAPAANRCT